MITRSICINTPTVTVIHESFHKADNYVLLYQGREHSFDTLQEAERACNSILSTETRDRFLSSFKDNYPFEDFIEGYQGTRTREQQEESYERLLETEWQIYVREVLLCGMGY